MKSFVWDTGALVLYFVDHDIAQKLMSEIVNERSVGYIPQIVYSEFYYKTWQTFGEQAAIVQTLSLRESELKEYILNETDLFRVGNAKIKYPILSIVDAIVLTTARATKSSIVTTDNGFSKIKGINIKKLNF